MTTAAPPKLSAAQARAIAEAEVAVGKLEAQLTAAREHRDELRNRHRDRIPASDEVKDAGKDVRQAKAGGFLIRVTRFFGGEYFSLKDYRAAGGVVTEEMQAHISRTPRERWTVKDLQGPKRPGAVEPS